MAPEACTTTYHTPRTWTLHIGASFDDVAPSSIFYPYIENLFHNGITAGCGNGNYCPDDSIRRDQMAVFLLKARYGSSYAPPPCRKVFRDVPCPGPYSDWVEQVSNEGFIEGCGRRRFCPEDPVERRDMAAWLLRALQGRDYLPPAATGLFQDVPIDDPRAAWIEDLYNRQVTAGCSAEPRLFCPDGLNTRAQMAVFLDKAFGLSLF
jgi:hypothetical protein